jgi:hypothetical protein
MNDDDLDELKRREEEKRSAHWSMADRQRALEEFVAYVEAHAEVPRNSPRRCKELEREKLGRLSGD